MTSADLCAVYKPWDVQKRIVNILMDEFWQEVCILFSPDELNRTVLKESKREREREFLSYCLFKYEID